MILKSIDRTIDSNVDQSQVFKIKTTAQAFRILSSNLYSNKIRAIIRELSCNAVDSHTLNKTEKPFEVHLPYMLEPYFSVKDFGVGLSEEEIFTLYTSYFESTKTQSNDFIGALGLGSKSPFAYVDSFTIESRYNGEKKDYSAYINELGVPTISLMNTSATSEENGLEVKVPVKEDDFYTFVDEAKYVFYAFDKHPVIHSSKYTPYENFEAIKTGKTWQLYQSLPGTYQNAAYAKQGNILYPLNDTIIKKVKDDTVIKKIKFVLAQSIIIDFPLGSLDIAASREEISYDEKTIDVALTTLLNLYDEITESIASELNSLSLYEALIKYGEYSSKYRGNLVIVHEPTATTLSSDYSFLVDDKEIISYDLRHNPSVGYNYSIKKFEGERRSIVPRRKDSVFICQDIELSETKQREKIKIYVNNLPSRISYPDVFLFPPDKKDAFLKSVGNPEYVDLSSIVITKDTEFRPRKIAETEANFLLLGSEKHETIFEVLKKHSKIYYIVLERDKLTLFGNADYSYMVKNYINSLIALKIVPKTFKCYIVNKKETKYKRFQNDKFILLEDYLKERLVFYMKTKYFSNLKKMSYKINELKEISFINNVSRGENEDGDFWNNLEENALKKAYLIMNKDDVKKNVSLFKDVFISRKYPEEIQTLYNEVTVESFSFYNDLSFLNYIDTGYSWDKDKTRARKLAVAKVVNKVLGGNI